MVNIGYSRVSPGSEMGFCGTVNTIRSLYKQYHKLGLRIGPTYVYCLDIIVLIYHVHEQCSIKLIKLVYFMYSFDSN